MSVSPFDLRYMKLNSSSYWVLALGKWTLISWRGKQQSLDFTGNSSGLFILVNLFYLIEVWEPPSSEFKIPRRWSNHWDPSLA